MRFLALFGVSACVSAGVVDAPVHDQLDTGTDKPVCAGLGEPCDALPPRPTSVTCGAAVRAAIALGQPVVWPDALSGLGCFSSVVPLVAGEGLLPYDVAAPLFSNGSDKGRFLVLPPGGTIAAQAEGQWAFPVGTLLLKIFALPLDVGGAAVERPIEVRVMLLDDDDWAFATYAWDEASQELIRVGDRGAIVSLTLPESDGGRLDWYFPSHEACLTCHRLEDARVLAVGTRQLHHRRDYGAMVADQLVAMDAIGVFSPPLASLGDLPRIDDPYDAAAPDEARARAWLHANCAHCHQPGGFAPPDLPMDLRVTTPFADTATCLVPKHSGLVTTGDDLIVPGNAEASALVQRIRTDTFEKMPPDGATRHDAAGIEVVEAWIDALDGCP